MTTPSFPTFVGAILGRSCEPLRREADWSFTFGSSASDGCVVATSSWWRILGRSGIAHSSEDDGQYFGRGATIDGEARVRELIGGQKVSSVSIDAATSDLTVTFNDGVTRLEVLSSSSGYENWQAYLRDGPNEVAIIAGGGGCLSFTSAPIGSRLVVGRALPVGWASGS